MAEGRVEFNSHFQDILDNIDVKLVAPFLTSLGIISANDQAELETLLETKRKRAAVKFILKKVRSHDNGDALFKDCLTKTNESSQGHRKLLSILYNPKYFNSGNAESDDDFLCELKVAYRSCIKEGNTFVLISVLADKYVETHSQEKYRKRLGSRKLKPILSDSNHFVCIGNEVKIIQGSISGNVSSNQAESETSLFSSDKEPSSSATAPTVNLKVTVHFEYGDQKFPKRISIGTMSKFYKEVISTLQKRIPGYRPNHLEFQCGSCYYPFTENTKIDDLCLEDENPELFIKASDSDDASVTPASLLASSERKQNQKVETNQQVKGKPIGSSGKEGEQCSSSVEDSEDVDEKHILKSMIDTAMGYLQRSLSIMIKSVMSKLYGTRETLQKLHQINSELQGLPSNSENKSGMTAIFEELKNNKCKLWRSDSMEAGNLEPDKWVWHDWVWHCKRILPQSKKEEWNVSEDLTSWKLDICLKLITRAKVAREAQDEVYIFASKYVCLKTSDHSQYNFVTLAEEATMVRNFYSHLPTYKDIIKGYRKHFDTIESFALKLLQWIKNENGNAEDVRCSQEDVHNIQSKREAYFNVNTAKWEDVSIGLKHLNFIDFRYILVSTPCTKRAGVLVSKENLAQLSNIPWAAIVDFDVASREDGLLNSLCEPEEDMTD